MALVVASNSRAGNPPSNRPRLAAAFPLVVPLPLLNVPAISRTTPHALRLLHPLSKLHNGVAL